MATDKSFAEYVADQMSKAGSIRIRPMFGEYGVYCNEQIVGLICDNQVFIKPTNAGREFIGRVKEAPAYPGAKPSFSIGDRIDDREWIGRLVALTASELMTMGGKTKRRVASKKKKSGNTSGKKRTAGKKEKRK